MSEKLGTEPIFVDMRQMYKTPLPEDTSDWVPLANSNPVPNQTTFNPSNRHAEYVLTWFGMAAAMVYMIRRKPGKMSRWRRLGW